MQQICKSFSRTHAHSSRCQLIELQLEAKRNSKKVEPYLTQDDQKQQKG